MDRCVNGLHRLIDVEHFSDDKKIVVVSQDNLMAFKYPSVELQYICIHMELTLPNS